MRPNHPPPQPPARDDPPKKQTGNRQLALECTARIVGGMGVPMQKRSITELADHLFDWLEK